jgi:hypothetical protein
MSEILGPADLEAFERQLRDLGVRVVQCLQPGLSAAELDAGELRLGFALPQEARTWLGWHDGVDLAPWPGDEGLADGFWKARWLKLAVPLYGVNVVLDCSDEIEAPVYIVDFQNPGQAAKPKCGSMRELLARWSGGLERGSWRWNVETRKLGCACRRRTRRRR